MEQYAATLVAPQVYRFRDLPDGEYLRKWYKVGGIMEVLDGPISQLPSDFWDSLGERAFGHFRIVEAGVIKLVSLASPTTFERIERGENGVCANNTYIPVWFGNRILAFVRKQKLQKLAQSFAEKHIADHVEGFDSVTFSATNPGEIMIVLGLVERCIVEETQLKAHVRLFGEPWNLPGENTEVVTAVAFFWDPKRYEVYQYSPTDSSPEGNAVLLGLGYFPVGQDQRKFRYYLRGLKHTEDPLVRKNRLVTELTTRGYASFSMLGSYAADGENIIYLLKKEMSKPIEGTHCHIVPNRFEWLVWDSDRIDYVINTINLHSPEQVNDVLIKDGFRLVLSSGTQGSQRHYLKPLKKE